MIELEPVSNEIHNQLGMLRHSWLKNKIINRDPAFIVSLRNKQSVSQKQFEDDIRQSGQFEKKIELFYTLLPSIMDIYSPINLINTTSLAYLPNNDLELIRKIFQELYLKNSNIEHFVQESEKRIKLLNSSFIKFRDLWFQKNVDLNSLEENFRHFQSEAVALYNVLKQFPRGIVLP